MPKSFDELQRSKNLKVKDLLETLEEYVSSGAAIGSGVASLIDRVKLSRAEREQMKTLARKGKDDQYRRRFFRDADDFQRLLDRLYKESV